MWTFLFYCFVFLCGLLTAIVDWEFFIHELLNINNIPNPVILRFRTDNANRA